MRSFLPLLACLTIALSAVAQEPARPRFEVRPATSPIRVDGVLDEQAWSDAASIPVAFEWHPGENTPARVQTDALITFDREKLYVGFRAADPDPAAIRANLRDRDTAFSDDTVGIMIDPFNDRRRAFQFRINPLGVQMEAVNSDVDGSEDWSWDAIWESVGRITADGYVVEIAVPFRALRFPRTADVQTWGFMVTRDYPRDDRYRMRSMRTDRDRNCLVCQFDELTGFRDMTSGRNLELDPTVTAHQTERREEFPAGDLQSDGLDVEAGLSARWGVTPNVTVSAALNPDFSQVEADAAQLDVNERFALFYPEKRPFFLEGSDFFSTPIQAVFTRTVADPSAGLKVTGKEGGNAFGLVVTQDRVNNLLFPSNQGTGFGSIDDDVTALVGRYRRDVGSGSSVGVLVTSRHGDDYANDVAGIDGLFRFGPSDSLSFQYLRSSSEIPDVLEAAPTGSFDDDAFQVEYSHDSRNWSWGLQRSELGPEFRADSGFVNRVDLKTSQAALQRKFWGKPGSWYTRIDVTAVADWHEDFGGEISENGQDFEISWLGTRQSYVEIGVAANDEYYDGRNYDNPRWHLYGESRPNGRLFYYLSVNGGETIDFANSREADFLTIEPSVELALGRSVESRFTYTRQSLDVTGGRLYEVDLAQMRLLYHFNIRSYARAVVQYQNLERDPSLYQDDVGRKSHDLFTQLLFSYKVNPQTLLLVGYSDTSFGDERIDLRQADRTLFLKLGYAWLF